MQRVQHTASGAVYRPEIEGVRAVAAILVATFHIWLGRVSGGVDVFFLLSGFLVTTSLLTQIDRLGVMQIAKFWGRLINRLLPAAYLVLCAVIVASIFLLPESRWSHTIKNVAASALYVENWMLERDAVDYLRRDAAVGPVQHYWALAVQGQFYFAWPLLFASLAFIARRMKVGFRGLATAVLLLLFAISLAYSVWFTQHNQPVAYFSTFTRIWEFTLGGLLAIVIARIALPPAARLLTGWVGLLAVLSCGFVLQVSHVFPGYAALWPTLGGALIVVAGTSGSRFGVDRFLGSRAMVYLGAISYAIYLWHFPILEFYRTHTTRGPVSFLVGACMLAATVALAALTHRFLERPVKRARIGSAAPWRAFAFGALCGAPVVVGLAAWSAIYLEERDAERRIVVAANPDYPGARVFDPGFTFQDDPGIAISPGPIAADRDLERLGDACGETLSEVPRPCPIAGEPGMPTIAVVGGSHSAQWLPALREIAASERWRIVSYTKSNCPFYLGEAKTQESEWDGCREYNWQVLELVKELNPAMVLMTSTRYTGREEWVPEGYLAAWRALGDVGIQVIAMRLNPHFYIDVSDCVELHGEESPMCRWARDEIIARPSPVELLADPPANVQFVDLTDYFCTKITCMPVIGNIMVYRHGSHVTATYARTLAPVLHDRILSGPGLRAFVTVALPKGYKTSNQP